MILDRLLWLFAVLGAVYLLLGSKLLAPTRYVLWWLAGGLFKDLGRKAVFWLYCPRCVSFWVGAGLGYVVLGHTAVSALMLDALVALGVMTLLVTKRAFQVVADPWVDRWFQETETGND